MSTASSARWGSSKNKVIDADDAVHLIQNGQTLAISGFVSMGAPEELLAALGRRFEATKSPRDLTLVFQGGPGDWDTRGINHLAKEGLVKRSIGTHYGQVPMLGKLALENKIEAYNLPMGAVSRMIRCAATGQPGHITEIGIGTMVDPKNGGGKISASATEDIVTDIEIDGKRYLRYKPVPIDVAFIRGSYADPDGNITFTREALYGDNLMMAMATRARRGIVIAQVEHVAARGSLHPREVIVPGTMVDCVVKAKPENHQMGYFQGWCPEVTGQVRTPEKIGKPMDLDVRKIIARRGALEILPNQVVNLGIGMPEGVAMVADEEHVLNFIELTTEPGIHGGAGLSGHNFGPARNYSALLTMDHQFDFYNGGGLDIAFLGNAETDQHGNVNVTRVGSKLTGPGGFVDITQSTKRVNLMGTFTAGGLEVDVTEDGQLKIIKEGKIKKFLKSVREITFSGARAVENKQIVNYITERCVFQLTKDGLELIEIAPGVDLKKDILDQMEFTPVIREPLRLMDSAIFCRGLMKLRQRNFGGSLDMDSRIIVDVKNDTIYVDLYNVNIKTLDDIQAVESGVKKFITTHFPAKKAHAVLTYDAFDVHPELTEEYMAMQKRLSEYYISVRRYSADTFRRHKLAQAFDLHEEGIHAPKAAEQQRDEMSVDEFIEYARQLGLTASPDTLKNTFVKANGDKPTMPRTNFTRVLSSLMKEEPGATA